MIDWSIHYARRAAGMAGSDVSELLALLSRPNAVLTGRPTFLGALQAFNAYDPRYEELPGPNSNRGAVSYASAGPDERERLSHRSP
jgi:hypothetical protein